MPEGPEVETIRRGLEQNIIGLTLTQVKVLNEKSFDVPLDLLTNVLVGSVVTEVDRKGKVLLISLDNEYTLMFHLKMTGQLVYIKETGERFAGGHPNESMMNPLPDNSTKVIINFDANDTLYFNDFRKFGWVKLVQTDEIGQDSLIARLSPEVLSDEFTLEYFASQLARHKKALIKPTILDQSTAAGIGNIYADESLHLAKIHPTRLCGDLGVDEIERLYSAIKVIIADGIEHGGTSFSRYVNALGGKGDYLDHARVFRREGQPCIIHADVLIEKTKVAGRGTHTCPVCQVQAIVKKFDNEVSV